MVLKNYWVSANFWRVLKSPRLKLESLNLELIKHKVGLGILFFEI